MHIHDPVKASNQDKNAERNKRENEECQCKDQQNQSYWPEKDHATCGLKWIMTVGAVVAFPTHTVSPELAGNKPYFVLFDKSANESFQE